MEEVVVFNENGVQIAKFECHKNVCDKALRTVIIPPLVGNVKFTYTRRRKNG